MSSRWERLSAKLADLWAQPNSRLLFVAALSSVTTVAAVLSFQDLRRRTQRQLLRSNVEGHQGRNRQRFDRSASAAEENDQLDALGLPTYDALNDTSDQAALFDDSLVKEFLARNLAFLGEAGCQRVRDSSCVVVGCGGVGSAAAVMLLRSGVGRLRLIDFDQVTLSSLNVRPIVPHDFCIASDAE